jgi:hypothetical protein
MSQTFDLQRTIKFIGDAPTNTAALSQNCPTVRIVRADLPGGCLTINASDFDPATMTEFTGAPAEVPPGMFVHR